MEKIMKITDIEAIVLTYKDLNPEACDSSQDDLIVKVSTDEGIVGIGETDTSPTVAKAMIEAPTSHIMSVGFKEILIGEDPLEPLRLWDKMYTFTAMTGRRGLGICAMGAIDMALWDICGKAQNKPIWQLLGGARQNFIKPYASLIPEGKTLNEYRIGLLKKVQWAKEVGFPAAKLEVCINGPYTHNGLQESDDEIVKLVADCRKAVGNDMTLMVDVAYCFPDWRAALRVIEKIEQYNIFFFETPIQIDDLDGYARLADHSPIRISAGEWQNTRFECFDLMDRGKIDVIQPDVGRVGGITEAVRVAQAAQDRGKLVVPHCWKTGIGIAASAHLAAVTPNCPFIEFLPGDVAYSHLRRDLTIDELKLIDGKLQLPQKPGLGFELNEKAVKTFRAV